MQRLAIGTLLDERFRILAIIGEGGMGVVYKAEQLNLKRIVAVKVLQTPVQQTPLRVARLQRETLALSELNHPGIVSAYEFGIWNGFPYATMEFVNGKTLQSELAGDQRLPPVRALSIMGQMCAAIAFAHKHGVVHRDLKPANIMLVDSEAGESVKIIDFGLARLLPEFGLTVQTLTDTGIPMGSIHYMSPEQCNGTEIDIRTDIYSMGAILHHCLTGKPPFVGDEMDAVSTMLSHLHRAPPGLAEVAPGVEFPEGIQNVVYKAMAKNRADRYSCSEEMQADLQLIKNGQGRQLAGAHKLLQKAVMAKAPSKKLPIWQTWVALLLVCIGAGTWWIMRSDHLLWLAILRLQKDPEQAYSLFTAALNWNRIDHALDDNQINDANNRLAEVCLKTRRYQQAEPMLKLIIQRRLELWNSDKNESESVSVSIQDLTWAINDTDGWLLVLRCLPTSAVKRVEPSQFRFLMNLFSQVIIHVPITQLASVLEKLPSTKTHGDDLIYLYTAIANRYAHADEIDKARHCLMRGETEVVAPSGWLELSKAYGALRDYEETKRCFDKVVAKPLDTGLLVGKARVCAEFLKDNDAAMRYLSMARSDATDPRTLIDMACIYATWLKDNNEARHFLTMVKPKSDDSYNLIWMAQIYAYQLTDADPDTLYEIASGYACLQDWESCSQLAGRLISLTPSDEMNDIDLGLFLMDAIALEHINKHEEVMQVLHRLGLFEKQGNHFVDTNPTWNKYDELYKLLQSNGKAADAEDLKQFWTAHLLHLHIQGSRQRADRAASSSTSLTVGASSV